MSIKMKLLSCLSAFVLMLSIMLVGVYAITHSIKLSGSINFQISDRSLWVKDVRISNDIYTEVSIDGFMPGYINGEFNLGIPSIVNQYGSFTLYFDIINTTQIPQHVSVDYSGLSSISGLEISVTPDIAGNSEELTTITSDTPVTTTLQLIVTNPNAAEINLSQIVININPYIVDSLTYRYNSGTLEATVTGCSEDAEVVIIPETVVYNRQTYHVTTLDYNAFNNRSSLITIIIPASVTHIGTACFMNCTQLTTAIFEVTEGWTTGLGSAVSSSTLSNPETAANFITSGDGYGYGMTRS